jgi:hypothetical protein
MTLPDHPATRFDVSADKLGDGLTLPASASAPAPASASASASTPAGANSSEGLSAFMERLADGVRHQHFTKLVLARPRGAAAGDLQQVQVRPLVLRDVAHLSLLYRHATRDVTRNLLPDEALATIHDLLDQVFANAHLNLRDREMQLLTSKRGKRTLISGAVAATEASPPPAPAAHDREKQRWVAQDRPFLKALGVTDAQQRVVPAMSRKWKQINKFVEVFSHALGSSPLAQSAQVRVVDFGSGKGYLTFAVHDHLQQKLGAGAQVMGVELRPDMVDLCNGVVQDLGMHGLRFALGDVRSHAPEPMDVMIALHACDVATDHAIHLGLRAGASIILCSPCCHKQIRPQLLSPHPLRPILQHGIHLGQEAEMVTDSLRALLLESRGYDTQVFEFVSLEHTQKNKMILAVKRSQPGSPDAVLAQIDEVKRFYGIREHCLDELLKARA